MKKLLLLTGILLLTTCSAFALNMPRWGMTAVDVYIPDSQYSGTVQRAFNVWAQAAGNKIRFRYNNTRFASNNAPIKVTFYEERAPYYITKSKRHETTGYFMDMDDGFINRAEIGIYTTNRDNKPVADEDLYSNLLMEVGYILGLEKVYGPCPEDSVMCFEKLGKYKNLSKEDKKLILEKYERTSNDIKDYKSKKQN